jgi:hypothetical protein
MNCTSGKSRTICDDDAFHKMWSCSSNEESYVASKAAAHNGCLVKMAQCHINIGHQDFS